MRRGRSLPLVLLVVCAAASLQAQQPRKIGEMELALVGLSASVDGARPAIPKNVASGVKILISGGGSTLAPGAAARLLGTFTVKGELSGPSLGETVTVHQKVEAISTAADLILPLPPMAISGEHTLSNLRIVNDAGGPILDLQPHAVPVDVVEQVLITSVKSRPLTLQEIKDKGIVLDSDDYQGFEFTLGVLMESKPVNLAFPVVFDRQGVPLPIPQSQPALNVDSVQVPVPAPRILPMLLTVPKLGPGVTLVDFKEEDIRIPSVLVIPGEVGFLKQFFSAQLFVGNGTPATANLIVRDVTGTLVTNDGQDEIPGNGDDPFSLAETVNGIQPKTMAIVGLGPDAKHGTGDDVAELRAGEQGQAEFLIRGDKEGFHKLEFNIAGVLDGLPTGPIDVTGKAVGGVLVRNAAFDVSFTVPTVVRAGEPFKLYATVNNIGEGIGNDVSMTLDSSSMSGLRLIGDARMSIDTLMPGDAKTLVFDFVAERTGAVVATYLRFEGEGGTGDIAFRVGVGERNVPLSPDTLVLPSQAELLPPAVLAAAMRVLGQAWSVANTPPNLLPAGVTRISKQVVTTKALALAEAGLRMTLKQPALDAVRDLLPDFYGPAPIDRGFDQLLRTTDAGRNFSRAVGGALAPAAANISAFEETYAGVAASGKDFVSFSIANGGVAADVNVSLTDNAGRVSSFTGADSDPRPVVTSAVIAPFGDPQTAPLFGLIAAPTAGPYRLELSGRNGGGPVDLTATYPRGDGSFTRVSASGINVAAGATARLAIDPARAPPVVEIDADADGTIDLTVPLTVDVVSASGPRFLSATIVGPETFETAGPFGFNVALLFDRVVNAEAADDLSRYSIPDNEFVSARRQLSGRLVLGALAQPEGPYIPTSVTVAGMTDLRGVGFGTETRSMVSLLRDPGAVITGRVINGDGQLAENVTVIYRANPAWKTCDAQSTVGFSSVKTDANGRYQFRYVYRDRCGWAWQMQAVDAVTGGDRSVYGNVRADGERITADIALLGRGGVTGIVRDLSGNPVPLAQVVAVSVLDPRVGGGATTDGDGRYTITGITVGAVTVKAAKGSNVGTATAQIGRAGTLGHADLTLNSATFSVSGKVEALESGVRKPAAGALVVFTGPDPVTNQPRDAAFMFADANGLYAFTSMPTGSYFIRAQLTSGEKAQITGISGAGDVHKDRDITVPITRNARVSGIVRYADGTEVMHPVVTLSGRGTQGEANGTFTLENVEVSTQPQTIQAYAPDGLREGTATVLVNQPDQILTDVQVTLNGIGTLDLTVIDSHGQPVRNQVVQISRTGKHVSPTDCTAFHLGTTDVFGKVLFPNLHVGAVRVVSLRASANGVDIATLDSTIPYEGATVGGVLRFGGGGVVKGRVIDDLGDPVFGANIEVHSKIYNSGLCQLVPGVSHRLRTDPDGNYRVTGVPVGSVRVLASQEFFPTPVGGSGVLARDGDELTLNMQLVNTIAGELSGTVFLPDGVTPAGAGVSVSAIGALPEVVVTTNDQGHYKFAKIFPAGSYRITVTDAVSGGVARDYVVLRTGEDRKYDFRLKGRGSVRINVVDGAGHAVSNALVTLTETEYPNETFEAVVEPSNEGVVTFPRVHEGRFSVTASDEFARDGGRVSGEVPGPDTSINVTVRMTVTGTVLGRFLMPDNATPIPFGTVKLIANGKVIGQSTTGTGDDSGEFRFDYVPAGTIRLEALDPATGRSGVALGQIITERQELLLDVRAEGLGTVTGVVTRNGVPEEGAHVHVSSGAFQAQATADGNGVYSVPGVPEGTITVRADRDGSLQGSATGTLIGDGTTATINVALQATGVITGVLTKADGVTPAPPSIISIQIGNSALTTTTNELGAYRFDLVPAGTRTISVDVIGSIDTAVARTINVVGGDPIDVPISLVGVGGISGQAKNASGAPVDGIVTLTATAAPSYSLMLTINADGTFTVPQVLAGPFTAKVQNTVGGITLFGTSSGVVTANAVTPIVVTLQSTGEVRGTVMRADGATPAIGANVSLRSGFAQVATTQVLSGGIFSFTGLPLATYSVHVHDPVTNGFATAGGFVLDDNGDIENTGTLTLDDTAIAVESITPADGAVGVSRTAEIVITFTDALNSAGGVSLKHNGNIIFAGGVLSGGGKVLTLTSTWPDAAEVVVEVTTGVTDLYGRHPAAPIVSRFYTVDTLPPSVNTVSPIAGDYNVAANTAIVVTFTEPLVNATVEGLVAVSGSGPVAGATVHGPANVLTFTPAAPLADNTVYTVIVVGAVDATGNVQTTPSTSTFSTTDTVAPVLAISSPSTSGWTKDRTPVISITRTDMTSGILRQSGTLAIDGVPVTPSMFDGFLQYAVPAAAPLGDGTHTIDATSADRAGNIGAVSGSFQLDATPPTVASLVNITAGAMLTGATEIVATATDSLSGVDRIELLVDGGLALTLPSPTFTATWHLGGVTEGHRSLTVRAVDEAGNVGPASAPISVLVNKTVLAVTITEPPVNYRTRRPFPATATVNEPVDRVDFTFNGITQSAYSSPFSVQFNVDGIPDQQAVTLTVQAFGAGTETATATRVVIVDRTVAMAHWPLDEGAGLTTADASLNGHAGTLVNGATWTPIGRFGKAVGFDGVDDGIAVADRDDLDVSSAVSIAAWVSPAAFGSVQSVLDKAGAYSLALTADGRLQAVIYPGGSGVVTEAVSALPLDVWSHVAATYDGATVRLYVNGVEVTTAEAVGVLPATTSSLWLGRSDGGTAFSGRLDEIRLYDRTLSAAEVLGLAGSQISGGMINGGFRVSWVAQPGGPIWAFGQPNAGSLGTTAVNNAQTPVPVMGLQDVAALSGDHTHAFAITKTGQLYAWGGNNSGSLGLGDLAQRNTPTLVPLDNVVQVSSGTSHTVALTASGQAYVWGDNQLGQFGDGAATGVLGSTVPKPVMSGVRAVAAGDNHTIFIKTDGTVWTTGLNSSGQLGLGNNQQVHTTAQKINGITTAVGAAAHNSVTVIRLSDGTLRAAGAGGTVGDGTNAQRNAPVAVVGLADVIALEGGSNYMLALKADGTVWGWGSDNTGELGQGTTGLRNAPVQVPGLADIIHIGAGDSHSLAASASGVVYGWGDNGFLNITLLGDGGNRARLSPVSISIENYEWKVATPQFDPYTSPSQPPASPFSIRISDVTPGATIYYTVDGTEPTVDSPTIPQNGQVLIDESKTVSARAFKAGMPTSNIESFFYEMRVGQLFISPNISSNHSTAQQVTITPTSAGTTIYYTIGFDHASTPEPTTASTLYTGPFTVSTKSVVKAKGFKNGWTPSSTATASFNFNYGTLTAPLISPGTGSHEGSVTVTLATTHPGATIRYTTNNTSVDAFATAYTGPLTVKTTTTLRARVFHPDYTQSAESQAVYTLQAAAPQFSLEAGEYPAGTSVTVTGDPATIIRYTLDGDDPTAADPIVASGGTLVVGNYTLKARAFLANANPSAITAAAYTVSGALAQPSLNMGDGFVLAVLGDGRLVTWGWDFRGQLGQGNCCSNTLLPNVVNSLTGVVAAGAGDEHAFFSTADGKLWGSGFNINGELGIGPNTPTSVSTPVVIPGIEHVRSVSGGFFHSVALTENGEVYAWGNNGFGQFGDGTQQESRTPKLIMSGVTAVTAGSQHTLFLKADGTVWGAGLNNFGQLGDGSFTNRSTPVQMSGISGAVAITAGWSHSAVLLSDGTVRAVGVAARLGDGTQNAHKFLPVVVTGLTNVIAIDAGSDHTLALKADGTVWAWGLGGSGALGSGTANTQLLTAQQVTGLSSVVAIGAGGNNSVAATIDEVVMEWGTNGSGEIDGGRLNRFVPVPVSAPGYAWKAGTPRQNFNAGTYSTPINVTLTTMTPGAMIHYTRDGAEPTEADPSVASNGTVLVDVSQTLTAKSFKAGMPPSNAEAHVYVLQVVQPNITPNGGTFSTAQTVSIATPTAGAAIRYTLDGTEPTEDSTLYTASFTASTQTRIKARAFKAGWMPSVTTDRTISFNYGTLAMPVPSPAPGSYLGSVTVSLAAMPGATIHYTTNNTVSGTGTPIYTAPLTFTSTTTLRAKAVHQDYVTSPELNVVYTVQIAPPVISLASGAYAPGTSLTVTAAPGLIIRMSLDGTDPTASHPAVASGSTLFAGNYTLKTRAFGSGTNQSAVSSASYTLTGALSRGTVNDGWDHALISTPDGRVIAWGTNGLGRLGDGTSTSRSLPVVLNELTGIVAVSALWEHSLALTADGHVLAWGRNQFGQLGDGSVTNRTRAVPVPSLSNIVQVRAGVDHSLALTADGQVYAWGTGFDGQLGNGSESVNSSVPLLVAGLPPVSFISAGDDTSFAVTTSGELYAWGQNDWGQLGDGSTTDRSVPTLITTIDNVEFVDADSFHAMARTRDGRTFIWGANDLGQFGNGTTMATPVPTTPQQMTAFSAAAFSIGAVNTMGVSATGGLWAWGSNVNGELGDNTKTQRLVPTQVIGLSAVSTFEIGQRSMAVTPSGEVWTWGAAGSGLYLGDGSTTQRSMPQLAFTLAGLWAPAAPVFSVAPGAYTNAVTLVVTTPMAGATIRYTLDGSTPDETSLEVPATGEIAINATTTIRARVFAPGRAPSAITAGTFVITP